MFQFVTPGLLLLPNPRLLPRLGFTAKINLWLRRQQMVHHPAYFVYRLILAAVPMVLVVMFDGCNSKAQRSPELQELRDRYDQVQEDMKEAEVIEIFEGYKPG